MNANEMERSGKIAYFLNPQGLQKKSKVGFSWTMLFFGFFVPAIRGDVKWALLSFLIAVVTMGLGWFVLPFLYNNKLYIPSLLEKGYAPADDYSKQLLVSRGIIIQQ